MWLRAESGGRTLWLGLAAAAIVGALAAWLASAGNPGNMGICGACFLRDLAGAMQLFEGAGPRVFRPEIAGIVFGALFFRIATRRFEARSGSHAVARFAFGVLMGIGALVFLGCPFRLLQRLGGGDLNAVAGLGGLLAGVGVGLFFETKRGYTPGRTQVVAPAIGLIGPFAFLVALAAFIEGGVFAGPGRGDPGGAPHAPWILALVVASVAGVLLSASGFCAISACRQAFQPGRRRMLAAAGVLIAAYAVVAALRGSFALGFENQPVAHGDHLWSALAMALVGLSGVLAGGCPVRQLVMAGEGNGDAFVTSAGILVGGALSHGLKLASSAAGPTEGGRTAVLIGLLFAAAYAVAATGRGARRD